MCSGAPAVVLTNSRGWFHHGMSLLVHYYVSFVHAVPFAIRFVSSVHSSVVCVNYLAKELKSKMPRPKGVIWQHFHEVEESNEKKAKCRIESKEAIECTICKKKECGKLLS